MSTVWYYIYKKANPGILVSVLAVVMCFISVEAYSQGWRQIVQDNFGTPLEDIRQEIDHWFDQQPESEHKARDRKQFMRWYNNQVDRLDANGRLTNFNTRNFEEYRRYMKTAPKPGSRITHGSWEDVTPDNFTNEWGGSDVEMVGRTNCLAIHPSNNNILYLGTPIGGMWKSTDGGTSWEPLTDGLPVVGISSIVINYNNPNIIYAITGDYESENIPSTGIIKSLDDGVTWQPTAVKWDVDIYRFGHKLIMHPDNPNIMHMITTRGIYSTNDGWNSFTDTLTGRTFRDIEFHPNDPDIMYASTKTHVFKTTDAWTTCTNLSTDNVGLPNVDTLDQVNVAVCPSSPNVVYALLSTTDQGNGYKGLYKSSNSGASWTGAFDTINIVGSGNRNQTWRNLVLEVDPDDHESVFAGGIRIFHSPNSGAMSTWTRVGGYPFTHDDIQHIIFRGARMYALTDGGIAYSTDDGQSWTNISGSLRLLQIVDFDVLNSTIIAGMQDNGTHLWDVGDAIGEEIWHSDGFECMFHPDFGNIMYASTQGGRFVSADWGNNFSQLPINNYPDPWDAAWDMHPTDPDIMYAAATKSIWRTTDAGANWTKLDIDTNAKTFHDMCQSLSDPDVMYITDRDDIWRADNIHAGNIAWNKISAGLPDIGIGSIAVDPLDPLHVWVSLTGYVEGEKVYESTNGGATWDNISGTLPNIPALAILHNFLSNNGLYLGTDLGVFYFDDNLSDWIYFSNGAPNTRVRDLKIDNGYLYIATFGRGMWRSSVYSSCPPELYLTQGNAPASGSNIGTLRYSAVNDILSERDYGSSIGLDVTYSAGYSITLDLGFMVSALKTAEFEANLDGCPD